MLQASIVLHKYTDIIVFYRKKQIPYKYNRDNDCKNARKFWLLFVTSVSIAYIKKYLQIIILKYTVYRK